MDTIHACRQRAYRFFQENPDEPYMVKLTDEKLHEMLFRYKNRPNENMRGLSWYPQEGDEGIGFRHTKRKQHAREMGDQ